MGNIMVKKVQLKPPIMTDAKAISSGPNIKTAFSTMVVQVERAQSKTLSAEKEKGRPRPNSVNCRDEEDDDDVMMNEWLRAVDLN